MEHADTELVFIIDRSGSMCGLEADTVNGFNAMIEKQKKEAGQCRVTTILFNHEIRLVYDRIPICGIPEMRLKDYSVNGCTALLDAIGFGIEHLESALSREKSARPMFVITTDGMENASKKYRAHQVKRMVKQKQQQNWEFLFLGANIDSVSTARGIGIDANRAASFINDSKGVATNYEAISEAISAFRSRKEYTDLWKRTVEGDRRGHFGEI